MKGITTAGECALGERLGRAGLFLGDGGEFAFSYFPRGRHRQGRKKQNLRRPLVGSQIARGVFADFVCRESRSLERLDESDDLFVAAGALADHGGLRDRGMSVENGLDLSGIDVESGADD